MTPSLSLAPFIACVYLGPATDAPNYGKVLETGV